MEHSPEIRPKQERLRLKKHETSLEFIYQRASESNVVSSSVDVVMQGCISCAAVLSSVLPTRPLCCHRCGASFISPAERRRDTKATPTHQIIGQEVYPRVEQDDGMEVHDDSLVQDQQQPERCHQIHRPVRQQTKKTQKDVGLTARAHERSIHRLRYYCCAWRIYFAPVKLNNSLIFSPNLQGPARHVRGADNKLHKPRSTPCPSLFIPQLIPCRK